MARANETHPSSYDSPPPSSAERPQPQPQLQLQPELQRRPTRDHPPVVSSGNHVTPFFQAVNSNYSIPSPPAAVAVFHQPRLSAAAVAGLCGPPPPPVTATRVDTLQQLFSGNRIYNGPSSAAPENAQSLPEEHKPLQLGGVEPAVNDGSAVNVEPEINVERVDDPYFGLFPPGWRFSPSDQELVLDYLKPKIEKKELPKNKIIELNIYNHHPDTLAAHCEKCGDKEWYFFTPRDRKYKNGQRPDRKAYGGYWKATGADKPIKLGPVTIGSRKALVFYEGESQKGVKTEWIMHEFQYKDAPAHKRVDDNDMRLDDYILCKIYKKSKTKNNERNRNVEQDDEEEGPGNDEPDAPNDPANEHQHDNFGRHPRLQPPQPSQRPPAHPQTPAPNQIRAQPNDFQGLVKYGTYCTPERIIPEFAISEAEVCPWDIDEFLDEILRSREPRNGLLEDVVNETKVIAGNSNDSYPDVVRACLRASLDETARLIDVSVELASKDQIYGEMKSTNGNSENSEGLMDLDCFGLKIDGYVDCVKFEDISGSPFENARPSMPPDDLQNGKNTDDSPSCGDQPIKGWPC